MSVAPSRIVGPPASMRRRLAAVALDYLPIAGYLLAVTLIGTLLRLVSPGSLEAVFGSPVSGQLTGFVLVTLPVTLYFVVGEASPRGATWGKRRLGLRVVTSAGERLTPGRSFVRTATKFLPWELSHAAVLRFILAADAPPASATVLLATVWVLVGLTLVLAFVDPRHRALHDRLASTTVIAAA
jgi:uncharacterized RDD family membrane protein YckC